MNVKKIIELRKLAEKAVAEMSDGDLKIKAFEVIFNHLIGGEKAIVVQPSYGTQPIRKGAKKDEEFEDKSMGGRILVLREEGFFKTPKSLSEIREELRTHGWYYPSTSLSGTLQGLAQKRELRRQLQKEGEKRVYKYTNP